MASAKPVTIAALNTRGMHGHLAYDLWRTKTLSGISYALEAFGDLSAFYADQRVVYLPQASVQDARISPMTYVRTREGARKDGQDSIFLEWARGSGANYLETSNGAYSEGPGGILVSDLSRPFVRYASDSNFISARFDRALFTPAQIDELLTAPVSKARARLIGGFLTSVAASADDVADPDALQASLRAVVLAVVSPSADRAYEASTVLGPLALDQACRFIDDNLHCEGLEMQRVVAATGVSRATLYRLFAPYGGLARFMWSRRLERARQMICDPAEGRTLVAISEACGFSDGAHFTRAFKAEFGVRPSDLRMAG